MLRVNFPETEPVGMVTAVQEVCKNEVQLVCSDGRLTNKRTFRPDRHCHIIAMPGGASILTRTLDKVPGFGPHLRLSVLQMIKFLVQAKGATKLRLLIHSDCGTHYQTQFGSHMQERTVMVRELHEAGDVARRFLDEESLSHVEIRLGIEVLEDGEYRGMRKVPFQDPVSVSHSELISA
jgi:hypothetical protein